MTYIDDATRVRHMLEAARRACEVTEGRTRDEFQTDNVPGLALVRLLEIVGEAARGVSPKLRGGHSEIPWSRITGTRNRIVHAYFSVDMDIVWQIAVSKPSSTDMSRSTYRGQRGDPDGSFRRLDHHLPIEASVIEGRSLLECRLPVNRYRSTEVKRALIDVQIDLGVMLAHPEMPCLPSGHICCAEIHECEP